MRRDRVAGLIGVLKLAKAATLVAAGVALLALHHDGLVRAAHALGLSPGAHLVRGALGRLLGLTERDLSLLALAAACGKSEASRRKDVASCSAISVDTIGTVNCLVELHNWKPAEARLAAHNYQRQLDSTHAVQEDSLWNLDAAAHRRDRDRCANQGDLVQCLMFAGWPEDRARRVADSLWARDAGRHARELSDCARRSRANPASCLMLSYRWDQERAQAAGDSIMRARMVQR